MTKKAKAVQRVGRVRAAALRTRTVHGVTVTEIQAQEREARRSVIVALGEDHVVEALRALAMAAPLLGKGALRTVVDRASALLAQGLQTEGR